MQPYNHREVEKRIYQMWEEGGYFTPQIDLTKKPFVMILVPPNASGAMHLGNIFSVVLQDILTRYHRMKGEPTLFVPGTDHGGYETQITYEHELKSLGKRSSDLTRRQLYENISQYVQHNNVLIKQQLRVIGASVDWSRFRFTLDKQAVQNVYATFKKLWQDGLIKRLNRNINYCPECKTTLPDIEVEGDEVKVCKAGHTVKTEKLPVWYVLVDAPHKPLKKPAIDAVQTGAIELLPISIADALKCVESLQDWCIARQNVWGIRIPVWYQITDPTQFTVWFIDKAGQQHDGNLNQLLESGFSWEEIAEGLERVQAPKEVSYVLEEAEKKDGVRYLQETDTFDTWFSSTEWTITILKDPRLNFNYFYPASIEVIGRDLLDKAVTREIMLACYLTGEPSVSRVYLHRLVLGTDKNNKMSKSMGNDVYPEFPIDYIYLFGADALRMALVSDPRRNSNFHFPGKGTVDHYYQFALKIWEFGQRILQMMEQARRKKVRIVWYSQKLHQRLQREDNEIIGHLNNLIVNVTDDLENFRFEQALRNMKKFFFEELKATYMNQVRQRRDRDISISVLRYNYLTLITLLHPFMPFMTEEIYAIFMEEGKSPLVITPWPQA